jgi:DNA polymerase (family 10)
LDRAAIADILDECGTLLELKGENPFRANAYHNAARAVLQLEGSIEERLADGTLGQAKGIGSTMVEKIDELVRTGTLAFHQKLREEVPAGLLAMMRINGFGPKRIKTVYDSLGVDTIDQLREACEDGRVASLKGFGKKSTAKILEGIQFLDRTGRRLLLPVARALAGRLIEQLKLRPDVEAIEPCGSLRRGKETIGDLDLLVASRNAAGVMTAFTSLPDVAQVIGSGPTKTSVLLAAGPQADLRVVTPEQFPFALHYFTGSKEHNVAMRARAQDEFSLKLNEYELAGPNPPVCKTEADIFEALGLAYVPPELREDTGEIEAALRGDIPTLVINEDITGVFHCHTHDSDGHASLEEMARACQARGYKYLGIADHSKSAFYANGLSPERVRRQGQAIDQLNKEMHPFRIFKGIESDILADGSLDYDDQTLALFDYVVASVHQPMNMSEEQMTRRVIRAVSHPSCTMLGHPTGRLLLQRDPYPIDIDAVLKACAQHGTMVEINANPHRLDLDWIFCKQAKALGVRLVINPDAHATDGFDDVPFGVITARRGWLTKADIFNTQPLVQIERWLSSRKRQA